MAEREWYYSKGEEQIGPVATNTILELIHAGVIGRETLVWHPNMPNWCGLESIQELAAHLPRDSIREASAKIEKQPKTEIRGSNYIVRHWRGELGLAVSWWVNGFVLNVFLTFLDLALAESAEDWSPSLVITYLASIITIYIWQIVGIWRSASNYIDLANNSIPRSSGAWGRIAQLFTFFGAISTISVIAPMIEDLLTLDQLSRAAENERYYIQRIGSTDLLLNGIISESSVSELIEIFESDSELVVLLLNSPGGVLYSAFRMADYIEQNDLTVATTNECVSACMLLLASAKTAAASTEASLVFHHPENRAEFKSPVMLEGGVAETEEFYNRLERYGVPSVNFSDYRKNGFTSLTLGAAYNANFINLIWDESSNEFYPPSALCEQINCFTYPVEIPASFTPSSINSFSLSEGQCFDFPDPNAVAVVNLIDCNELHSYEAIGKYELESTSLPAEDDMIMGCMDYFEPYVGMNYLDSRLDIVAIFPIQQSFSQGERTVVCMVNEVDGSKMLGSARNSGI